MCIPVLYCFKLNAIKPLVEIAVASVIEQMSLKLTRLFLIALLHPSERFPNS